jgi:hypothetical protein
MATIKKSALSLSKTLSLKKETQERAYCLSLNDEILAFH